MLSVLVHKRRKRSRDSNGACQTRRLASVAIACGLIGLAGCKTTSSGLSATKPPTQGVAEKDEPRWLELLKPRPHVDKVDPPVWEVPDREPDADRVQLAYAQWMEQSGKADVALAAYSDVVERQPDHADAQLGLARIDIAAGRIDAARTRLETILATEPRDVAALSLLGKMELDQGRADAAAARLVTAVEADPGDERARYLLGIARARQGRLDEARRLFIATVGDAEAHHNLGMLLKDTRPTDAAAEFAAALAKKPSLEASRVELAKLRGQSSAVTR